MATPAELLSLPVNSNQLNRAFYHQAEEAVASADYPLLQRWRMWMHSYTYAQQLYLLGEYEEVVAWSLRCASASVDYLSELNDADLLPNDENAYRTLAPLLIDQQAFQGICSRQWVAQAETGLCWAAVGAHWEDFTRLLSIIHDKFESRQPDPWSRYYWGMSRWYEDRNSDAWIEYVKATPAIEEDQQLALCLAVVAAVDGNSEQLHRQFDIHLRSTLTAEHDVAGELTWGTSNIPPFAPTFAATIAWHLAEQAGVYPQVFAFLRKYLIVVPEEASGKVTDRATKLEQSEPECRTPADHLGLLWEYDYRSNIDAYQELSEQCAGTEHLSPLNVADLLRSHAESVVKSSYLQGNWRICRDWSAKLADAVQHYLLGNWQTIETDDDDQIAATRWFRDDEHALSWVPELESAMGLGKYRRPLVSRGPVT